MTDAEYNSFAGGWALPTKCGASGRLSPEATAFAYTYMQSKLNLFSYDPNRFQQEVAAVLRVPTNEECNQAAVLIATWKQDTQYRNEAIAAQQQQWLNLINSNKSNQTYCNSIGTQTICSRY